MQHRQHKRSFKLVAAAATAAIGAAMTVAVTLPSASAAVVNHTIAATGNDTFNPAVLTAKVTVGDTVTFTGLASHNANSTAGSVAPFKFGPGDGPYVYKTTTAGKHTFECTFHDGMVGSFTVVAATGAPAVKAPTVQAPAVKAPAVQAPAVQAPAVKAPAVKAPAASAAAVTHKVVTVGETFSPKDIAVKVGDTVNITGLSSHPTKSDVFPAGAAPIAMTAADISYKVTVPGKHAYLCIAHSGMVGSFTATGTAAPGGAAKTAVSAPPAAQAAPPAAGAAAVTHKVVAAGVTFTPKDIDVKVGDTVNITGLATHPTKSDVFPAGAAPIAMTTADINYKVTAPGKHTYLCVAHAGMVGSFTATGAAAPGGAASNQVSSIPLGGVATGGGSTAGLSYSGLFTLGGGLLIAAFMSLTLSRRFARQK